MNYQFTPDQIARIDRLSLGTDDSPFNNHNRPLSGVYGYILNLISLNNDPNQGPSNGVDAGIWQWFRGAEKRLR